LSHSQPKKYFELKTKENKTQPGYLGRRKGSGKGLNCLFLNPCDERTPPPGEELQVSHECKNYLESCGLYPKRSLKMLRNLISPIYSKNICLEVGRDEKGLLTFTCRACPQKPPCTEETLDLTKWVS
jgi:hypothetical protein